ncbi:MAG: signal transduction histidine kinase [Urechidicola sp.]|jgi:signal transduction histidine kinase
MKNPLVFSIFIYALSIFNSFGQNVNSLSKNDENIVYIDSIETLNTLSRDLTFIDSKKSMKHAQSALRLSLVYNYKLGEAYAYLNIGSLYSLREIYTLGMDYIQKSQAIFKSQNDVKGLANCYISLGLLYGYLNDFEEQIKYYKRSLDIFNKLNLPERIAVSLHNLGESYYNNKDLENSREMTLLSIDISKSIELSILLSSCYNVMGRVELSSKNYDKAEVYFQKVIGIYRESTKDAHKITTLESLIHISEIYKIRKQYDKQIYFLNQASEFALAYNLSSYLPEIYHEKILYYSNENNQKIVKKLITEQKLILDNIHLKSMEDKTDLVKSSLLSYTLEKQNSLLAQTELRQKGKIEIKNTLLIVAIISFIILVLFVLKLMSVMNKVKRKNKKIKNQNIELQSLISARNKLFEIIGHDLRGPIGTFKQSIDHLVSKDFDLNDIETLSELLRTVQDSSNTTYELLESLLLWAGTQQNDIIFSPVDYNFHETITKTLRLYQEATSQKKITILNKVPENQTIYADPNMITTVIRNLISNAIKFTPNDKTIAVSINKNEKHWVISVEDQGVGISAENINKIFDINSNFTNFGTNNEKGSGLGFLICQEFVKKHDGEIRIESKEGIGSLFSFTIPLSK